MLMGVDKCRHNHAALCIHILRIRISLLYLFSYPHHNYGVTIHCNSSVLEKCVGCVPCDHSAIPNNKHMVLLLFA